VTRLRSQGPLPDYIKNGTARKTNKRRQAYEGNREKEGANETITKMQGRREIRKKRLKKIIRKEEKCKRRGKRRHIRNE
jgi:hypothetical protein